MNLPLAADVELGAMSQTPGNPLAIDESGDCEETIEDVRPHVLELRRRDTSFPAIANLVPILATE